MKTKKKISTSGKYSFKPSEFSANLGFIIVLEETDKNLNKFLKVHNKDTVYIPWRYFNDVLYYKKTGSYKIMEVILRNDNEDRIKAKFNLPWAYYGDIISEKDVNSIISNIIEYRGIQRNKINTYKRNVGRLSDQLFKFKSALLSQKLSAKIFKEQTEKDIRTKTALLLQKRKEMEAIDKKISRVKSQFNLLEANFVDIRDTLSKFQTKNENNLILMDDNLRKGLYADNAKKIVNAKDLIKTDLHVLATVCKNVNFKMIEIASFIGDFDSVTTLLHKIKPINN